VITEFAGHRLDEAVDGVNLVKPDRALFAELVRGAARNRRDLDDMIAAVLVEDWTVERLETLLACILRAGAHELADRPDVRRAWSSANMSISPMPSMADKETGLINGVLDRLARELRPDELAVPGGPGKTAG